MKKITAIAFVLLAGLTGFAAAADGDFAEGDFVVGPDYAPSPETMVQPGVPVGAVHDFVMSSADSKVYPGIARIENDITAKRDAFGNRIAAPFEQESVPAPYTRHVWVYIPAQYVPGTPAPFIVAQDGHSYQARLARVLDNLIAQHRVPVMIAVMPDSGGSDAQGSERGLEYDTLSGRYTDFIEKELLPKVAKDYNVTFTTDPDGRATMGGSSGAAAAFTMAWYHPELYHRVLSFSGTYVNQQAPPDPATPHGAWEYHDHMVAEAPRKPIRIWMEVGEKDLHFDDPESTYHNWPLANRRMAAVLKHKGYHYRFVFANGAKHVDPRMVDQTQAAALEWLWHGYKPR